MKKAAAVRLLAPALAALHLWAVPPAHAGGAAAARGEAGCAAARDKALATLEEEAVSVAVAFDNDIAVAESPEYELLKAKEALLREIDEEKRAVRSRYRRCAPEGPSGR